MRGEADILLARPKRKMNYLHLRNILQNILTDMNLLLSLILQLGKSEFSSCVRKCEGNGWMWRKLRLSRLKGIWMSESVWFFQDRGFGHRWVFPVWGENPQKQWVCFQCPACRFCFTKAQMIKLNIRAAAGLWWKNPFAFWPHT